ncbi:heme biosynthesis protein HemY [Luteimonas saliphila]|uniref:heme biosynthesis protein HemY n=1 Tax=Luteimonas saliphila TaxID=2804919 RepID=UPI00192DFBE9|nr:heme biosynthesis HemY N-terminal domain-containing protein [Luteimonas saliphila]
MNLFRNLLLWLVLALAGALVAQLLLSQDPGYVLVRWRGYDYTTTVLVGAALLFAAAFALWLLWALLSLPFRAWGRHRDTQARTRVGDGFDALHQGHWTRAEKLLAQAAEDERVEAAARIGAAEAALARGDAAAARAHLEAFDERHPASRAIASAELALRDQRPTDALVALDAPAAQPLPPRGLALRAEALGSSGQAAQAWGLLGALRQQHAWPEAVLAERELVWAEASLREAADANALAERWDALPKALKAEPAVVGAYAARAAAFGWEEAATGSIEHALDTRWDEALATRYGLLPVGRIEHRRAQSAAWLNAHPASPALLLTLARLSQASGDWPQAEAYLHRALAQGGGADVWEALGHGYAAAGDDARARQCHANALAAGRGEAVTPLPARELHQQIADEAVFEDRDEHGVPRLRG